MLEPARNLAQRNVRSDERDGEFFTGQTHCEIFDGTPFSKKFGLPWELKPDFVHARFVNRSGYDCIEFAPPCEGDCFFERSPSGTRTFRSWLS